MTQKQLKKEAVKCLVKAFKKTTYDAHVIQAAVAVLQMPNFKKDK